MNFSCPKRTHGSHHLFYTCKWYLPIQVLLDVENALGHHPLKYVQVVFLPPHMKSLIQPLYQGIIAAFKKHFQKFTFKYYFQKLKNVTINLTKVWETFLILDCINYSEQQLVK